MQIAVGTYVGDSNEGRPITGIGFAPDLVVVKAEGQVQLAVWKTREMPAGKSGYLASASAGLISTRIESLDEDGFTIGNSWPVNRNGYTYHWLAIADNGNDDFTIGKFTGDGTDNRDIAGVGFEPAMVWCQCEDQEAVWSTADMAAGYTQFFSATNHAANIIQSFAADGFQVGSSNYANQNGKAIYWAAFKKLAGMADGGQYAGDGTDDRTISGLGFRPDVVMTDATGSYPAVWHPSTKPGDTSFYVGSSTEIANAIQALEADGFQLGSHNHVNASGSTYTWWAWKVGTIGSVSKASSESGESSESAAVHYEPTVAEAATGTDAISVLVITRISVSDSAIAAESLLLGLSVTDEGVASETIGTDHPISDALELIVDVAPLISDWVQIAASVFHDRMSDALQLQVDVMPLVVDGVLIEATVINQALEAAALAEVIAPVAEVTFL
jgi:hypothetical protein